MGCSVSQGGWWCVCWHPNSRRSKHPWSGNSSFWPGCCCVCETYIFFSQGSSSPLVHMAARRSKLPRQTCLRPIYLAIDLSPCVLPHESNLLSKAMSSNNFPIQTLPLKLMSQDPRKKAGSGVKGFFSSQAGLALEMMQPDLRIKWLCCEMSGFQFGPGLGFLLTQVTYCITDFGLEAPCKEPDLPVVLRRHDAGEIHLLLVQVKAPTRSPLSDLWFLGLA